MKSFSLALLLLVMCLQAFAQTLEPVTIFSENFESADALSQWQIAPNGGRVRLFEDPRNPANHGLLMDDPINDAIFSQNAVSRTISIAGYSDVRVLVDILSFNDEPNIATNAFDGVRFRVGDKVQAYPLYSAPQQTLDMALDPNLLNLAIRGDGLLTIELDQYDNFSAPDDGLFFDNVRVVGFKNRQMIIEAPQTIKESDPLTLTVLISPPPDDPVQLQLWDGTSVPHGYAIYPAGATMAQLTFPNFDNDKLDGDRQLYVGLSDGHLFSPFTLSIRDDEFAGLSIIAPTTMVEGSSANGSVAITASHDNWLPIYLESSDPNIAFVPGGYVNAAFGQIPFTITAIENRRVLPDREVTITARIGSETAQTTIKVIERNTLNPAISGATDIAEGAQDQIYVVSIDGISDQPLTVNLAASPTSVSLNPATLIIQPGSSQGLVKVSVADDTQAQGNRPFTITAQVNATQAVFRGRIVDNEITGFSFDLPDRLQADSPYSLTLHAVNGNRSEVTAFNGAASVYLKDKTSGAEQLLDEVSFAHGDGTVSIRLPYSASGSSLVVRTADGVSSTSPPIVIFTKLAFAASDIVWDSNRQLFYAISGGSALPGHVQSVTPIDPSTAQIKDGLFVGGDPRKVVITDNGKYLYISDWASSSVKRVDLDTFAVAATITLRSDIIFQDNTFVPFDLLPVPTRPLDIIVSQNQTSYPYHSTRLYVNGSMQLSNSLNAIELVPGGALDEFYGSDSAYSGGSLMRFKLTPGGFNLLTAQSGLILGSRIEGQNDLIFSEGGRVANGKTMLAVTDLKLPFAWGMSSDRKTVMAPDIARSRVYYAHANSIAAFDTVIFQNAGEVTIPNIGNIVKIIRWGDAGIALQTDNAELVIFNEDPLVPTGPNADLAVNIAAAPQPIFVGGDLTYTATVENLATNTAHNVQLSFLFNASQTIGSIDALGFPQSLVNSNLLVSVGDMAAGAKYQIRIATKPTAVATLVATVAALSSSLESNYTNNKAAVVLNVGFQSTPNSVNVVKMNINDLVTQPVGGNLVVSIGAAAPPGIANHIATIDPRTGLIGKFIETPTEPTRLAVSDDGSVAYAISWTRTRAYQVDLNTGEFIRTVPFNVTNETINAYDIKVLPGTHDSIIIGSSWDGARIYDKGVLRRQTSGTYQGMLIALLPDPSLAFGFDNNAGLKYQISSSGVKTLAQLYGLYASALKGDGYYMYTDQGKVIRADLMSIDGTVDLNAAFPQTNYGPIGFEPERALHRVYYARENQIVSIDSDSYLRIRVATLSLPSRFTSLERWGADGFAARLESGELAIIRSDLVPDAPSAIDLLADIQDGLTVNQPQLTISGEAYHGQGISSVKIGDKLVSTSTAFTYWSGTVDLVEGENTITITATSLGTPADTRTITRKVTYTPASALIDPAWIAAHFDSTNMAQSGPNDDPDGDGQSNLAEFLFGADPLAADKPQLRLDSADGGFALHFTRRNTPDFDFVVETSSDLSSWQRVTSQSTDTPITGADNYLSSSFTLPTNGQNQFFRVQAVRK